jgi:hypothetical protein
VFLVEGGRVVVEISGSTLLDIAIVFSKDVFLLLPWSCCGWAVGIGGLFGAGVDQRLELRGEGKRV